MLPIEKFLKWKKQEIFTILFHHRTCKTENKFSITNPEIDIIQFSTKLSSVARWVHISDGFFWAEWWVHILKPRWSVTLGIELEVGVGWGSLLERGREILRGNSADGACDVASKPLIDANSVEDVTTIRYHSDNLGFLVITQADRTATLHVLRFLIWISRFQRLAGFLRVYDPGATWIQSCLIHHNYNAILRGGATSTVSPALYFIS